MKAKLFYLFFLFVSVGVVFFINACKKEYHNPGQSVEKTCDTFDMAVIKGCRLVSYRNSQHDSGSTDNYYESLHGYGYDSMGRYSGWGIMAPKWWEGTDCEFDPCNNQVIAINHLYQTTWTNGILSALEIDYDNRLPKRIRYYSYEGDLQVKVLQYTEEVTSRSTSHVVLVKRSANNDWMQTHARYYNSDGDISSETNVTPDRSWTTYITYDTTVLNPELLIPEYNLLTNVSRHVYTAIGETSDMSKVYWIFQGTMEKNEQGYLTKSVFYTTDDRGVRKENTLTYTYSNCP